MDNKEQELSLQQQEELLKYSDPERVKELFEYEMTQVLLGFKEEKVRFSRRDVSEYIDMELPDADVQYSTPDIELKGIEYENAEELKPLENGIPEVKITDTVIPGAQAAKISINTDMPDNIELAAPIVNAADLKSRSVTFTAAEVELVSSFGISTPQAPCFDQGCFEIAAPVLNAKLKEPKAVLKVEVPEADIETGKLCAGKAELSASLELSDMKAISEQTQIKPYTAAEPVIINKPDIDVSGLENKVQTIGLRPVTEREPVKIEYKDAPVIDREKFEINDTGTAEIKISSFEIQTVSISDIPEPVLGKVDVHEVPEYAGSFDLSLDTDAVGAVINAGIEVPSAFADEEDFDYSEKMRFELKPGRVECPAVPEAVKTFEYKPDGLPEIAVRPEGFTGIPACPDISDYFVDIIPCERAKIEYPDIPECPDFSKYYDDILDSIHNG